MSCPTCQGEFEYAGGNVYARCRKCSSIFMNLNGTLTPYPLDESMRPMMEQALGFAPSSAPAAKPAPATCTHPACATGVLEKLETQEATYTRCPRCGILSKWDGNYLLPVIVQPPGGGWNAGFQAIFEEQLGFPKRVRKNPPGVVGP